MYVRIGLVFAAVLAASALGAALGASVGPAFGQAGFPTRPITMVVPLPAGGTADLLCRFAAEKASGVLGQQVVIENRAGGAGGRVGTEAVLRAAPDGYTLLCAPQLTFSITHLVFTKSAFDTRGMEPISVLATYPLILIGRAEAPFSTTAELVAYARANPGKVNYASTGTGTTPHLVMEQVAAQAGVDLVHVPFKGNADSTQALLGGHVQAQSDATGWGRYVDAGQMRLLVIFNEQRSKKWPDTPTAKELGLGIVSNSPYGIVGPKGMDPAIVRILHDAFRKALDDPEHLKVIDQLDQEIWYKNSEDYARWARESLVSEKALIERLGLAIK